MPPTIQGVVIAFAVLLVAFRLLQLMRPRERRLPLLRRGFWTDLAYWGFTPLVTRAITRVSVVIAVVPLALLIYGKVDKDLLLNGFGPAARLPLWLQAVLILDPRRLHRLLDAPRLPWPASVALPRRAPFLRRPRLALGRAAASRQRCADAHRRHAAGACAWVCAGGGSGHRAAPHVDGDPRARQPRLGLGAAALGARLAALPPLAPHRRGECARQELRGLPAAVGHPVRDLLHAQGARAPAVRYIEPGS